VGTLLPLILSFLFAIYKETLATSYKVRNLFAIALPGYHATLLLLLASLQKSNTQTPTPLYNHFAHHVISFNAFLLLAKTSSLFTFTLRASAAEIN
jgi:hypothetical protein